MVEHALDTSYLVPDRVTGLQELEELRRVCSGRVWNFVRPFALYRPIFLIDRADRLK
jgi:hypothetical protein